MAARHAFVLNLDAELELEAGAGYAPTRAVTSATTRFASEVATTLVPADDVVVHETTPHGACEGLIGIAWCPTPRAIARLAHVGADVPPAPSIEVLRRVARRDFAYVTELPGACVHEDLEAALAHLATPSPLGRGYRLKRVHGMAGRGHRVVRGRPTAADVAFVRASGPAIIVEPELAITRELSLHGFLDGDGHIDRGDVCTSTQTAQGAWLDTTRLARGALCDATHDALVEALDHAGAALRDAGYFGPFGIDAFEYEDGAHTTLRARSEINARYSMGWAVGFAAYGARRPDLVRGA